MQFGVDEAGKGPVLGSMFAAAVRADPAVLPAGIDDSKNLSVARREELASALRADDRVTVGVAEIPPARYAQIPLRPDDVCVRHVTRRPVGAVQHDGHSGRIE